MENKKRKMSDEISFCPQLKYYVSENLKNQQSDEKMKEIYAKTVNILFRGAKETTPLSVDKYERYRDVDLNGNGMVFCSGSSVFEPDWLPDLAQNECNMCLKKCRLQVECSNCYLNLCEFCGFNCCSCKEPICCSCITIFNCTTANDQPVCNRCKD